MAFVHPKAPHEPFNPAPWYADYWHPSWPEHEPRDANWNCSFESRKHHHGNIPIVPMITEAASRLITGIYKNRWRCLMSVDDAVSDVFKTVEELGLMDSTYFFFSSDHGFQLGQFNIPMDKRNVYEWDTKIHLLVKGPGIAAGSSFAEPGTQVDIAPTMLGLAGIDAPESMDGKSLAPFLISDMQPVLASTRLHLSSLGSLNLYRKEWRQEVFIEYYYCEHNIKCLGADYAKVPKSPCTPGNYPETESFCATLAPGNNSDCWCNSFEYPSDPAGECYPTEDTTNNFIAIRNLTAGGNTLYAEFQKGDLATAGIDFDNIGFVEYFDLDKDPLQMNNLATSASHADLKPFSDRVHMWLKCSGKSCP